MIVEYIASAVQDYVHKSETGIIKENREFIESRLNEISSDLKIEENN